MGATVATEFALALEDPDGPYVQNTLIFALGKTILGALRELADIPYERLLPPRLHKPFAASFKLTFTRDGDKTIPIIAGSRFNCIVTNTEKIRIQRPNVRNGRSMRLFAGTLPNGAPARLALYFPSIEVRDGLRPAVAGALALHGIGTDQVLAVDNKSSEATRRAFEAVARDPAAHQRVLLLVNMGTEGWNCPSLFACALVRKLNTSNNFVLQAASRCLRQVPGNDRPARVYLTRSNRKTLENQLAETYGTSLKELDGQRPERVEKDIVLRCPDLPPLLIRKRLLRVRPRAPADRQPLRLVIPDLPAPELPKVQTWSVSETAEGVTRFQRLDAGDETLTYLAETLGHYTAAAGLAANYHLPTIEVIEALRAAYGQAPIPGHHLDALGLQIGAQRADYERYDEIIDVAVALVRAGGFDRHEGPDGPVYTARISFAKDREPLFVTPEQTPDPAAARATSFHYEGNFDSGPEREFLDWVLELLRTHPHRIDGIWFTGGLTDPAMTDLLVEYLGEDGRWHAYTPDFVIRR
ncbi:MAG: restriction endonuclease subunit R, partial [Gammaproteobacteria bacterium]